MSFAIHKGRNDVTAMQNIFWIYKPKGITFVHGREVDWVQDGISPSRRHWINKLKPSPCASSLQPACWACWNQVVLACPKIHSDTTEHQHWQCREKEETRTAVGTRDSSCRSFSTPLLLTILLFMYMVSQAASIRVCHFTSSARARDICCVMSRRIPILGTWSNGMRQWGQGQQPRFRMLTRNILTKMWVL